MTSHVDDHGPPHRPAFHIGHREHDRSLRHAAESAREDIAVRPGNSVIAFPPIRQRIAIGITRRRGKSHAPARRNRRGGRGERGGGGNISGKGAAIKRDIKRSRSGGIFAHDREMHVGFEVRKCPAEGDAAIVLAGRTALRGVQQMAGVGPHAAVEHQRIVSQIASARRMEFHIVLSHAVLGHVEPVAFPLLQRRLIVGINTVNPVSLQKMDGVVREPP